MFLVKISNVEGGPFQLSNAIEKCFETKQKFIIPNKKKYMLKIQIENRHLTANYNLSKLSWVFSNYFCMLLNPNYFFLFEI